MVGHTGSKVLVTLSIQILLGKTKVYFFHTIFPNLPYLRAEIATSLFVIILKIRQLVRDDFVSRG